MNYSTVILTPTEHADAIRALSEQMSTEENDDLTLALTAEASADGTAPATHYGCRTWARQSSVDLLAALKADPPAGYEDAVAATVIDHREDKPGIGRAHWVAVLEASGLQPVAAEQTE